MLSDPHKGRYFVAEAAGQVVGQLGITLEWSDWRNGNYWWVQSVYVAASTAPARRAFAGFMSMCCDRARGKAEAT